MYKNKGGTGLDTEISDKWPIRQGLPNFEQKVFCPANSKKLKILLTYGM